MARIAGMTATTLMRIATMLRMPPRRLALAERKNPMMPTPTPQPTTHKKTTRRFAAGGAMSEGEVASVAGGDEPADFRRLHPLGPVLIFVLDVLILLERLETLALDDRMVDKDVTAPLFG